MSRDCCNFVHPLAAALNAHTSSEFDLILKLFLSFCLGFPNQILWHDGMDDEPLITFTRHFGGVSCISIMYAILESTTDLEADTRQLPSCRTALIEEAAPKRLCRISRENPPKQDFL